MGIQDIAKKIREAISEKKLNENFQIQAVIKQFTKQNYEFNEKTVRTSINGYRITLNEDGTEKNIEDVGDASKKGSTPLYVRVKRGLYRLIQDEEVRLWEKDKNIAPSSNSKINPAANHSKSKKPIENLKNIEFTLSEDDIRKYIKLYMEGGEIKNNDGRTPTARYSSFDYCFNYFQQFKRNKNIKDIAKNSNLEKSCLHLGFYLASWGMFRGNAKLLQKSLPYLKNQLEVISEFDENIWEIDVDNYNHENIELLLSFKKELIKSFDYKPTNTLITKIMLGVFGNVMAYDRYVEKTYKSMQMGSFSKPCLLRLNYFYTNFKTTIDREVNKLNTLTFPNNDKLQNQYTVAKVLDMIGFIKGRIDNE